MVRQDEENLDHWRAWWRVANPSARERARSVFAGGVGPFVREREEALRKGFGPVGRPRPCGRRGAVPTAPRGGTPRGRTGRVASGEGRRAHVR
jgi:hypothetical protein